MADIETVRVAVRIRPLVQIELEQGYQNILNKINGTPQICVKNCGAYTFDYAFDTDETQEQLYNLSVKDMVPNLMKGYNVTILAYGQTGSGKTHTMGTAFNGVKNTEMGVIPRAMIDIFDKLEQLSSNHQFKVKCSFMELYQEQLYDLLSTNSREKSIVEIREDGNKGIIIPGLTEIPAKSATETIDCLIKGSAGRAVGATAMNQQSSRSHAIFTVTVQMMENNDPKTSTISKFHLVDLAGSERSKKTKTTGDRFKEGVKINQGLLALGNVISALGTGQLNGYIGYRDSKLTRLLQDSLGGNSVTLMIACVSPADYNMDESLSTLRYADRARKIKNKPIVNQDPNTAEINRLNIIIQKLRLELLTTGGESKSDKNNVKSPSSKEDLRKMREQINFLLDKNRNLQQQLQGTLQDVAELEMRVVVSESAHDQFENKFGEFYKLFVDLNEKYTENNCSSNSVELVTKINVMRKFVDEIDDIIRLNKQELLKHKLSEATNNSLTETDSLHAVAEDVQEKLEAFTTKQIDYNNELRRINRELNLKEEHQQKVAGNLSKFCVYEGDNSEANIKECETKIQILENEKSELLDKLKYVKENASAKIAEDRRKRLQQLEVEINELKKKNLQQSKLLKVREKESQKILNLNSEIQLMKAAKVKLIRQMKAENESFRQWKLNREKQLTQLKEKDRKRQNEMVRMESLHVKQKNVLKRKVEEAMAINKKLKDTLDKQKTAQSMRKLNGGQSGKVDQVLTTIDNELEIVMSVIDAQYSLDQLMDDRAIINNRLKTLKELSPENTIEINSITEDLEMRNAQIEDIQQKIHSTDIETKMKLVCDGIKNMPEAKAALSHLFNAISELRREYAAKEYKIYEIKTACDVADEQANLLQRKYDTFEKRNREEMSNIEKNYEDKITVLLRELNNVQQVNSNGIEMTPEIAERMKIQQETLDKLEYLREELAEYKEKCATFEKIINNKIPNNYSFKGENPKLQALMVEHLRSPLDSDISVVDEDDLDKDPDWKVTPIIKRFKRKTNETSIDESSKSNHDTILISNEKGVKRSSDGTIRCNCNLPCNTRRCKCRVNNTCCSEKCGCNETCINKNHANKTDDKENNNINEVINQEDNTVQYENMSTPMKKPKSSTDGENENKFDITTPLYPFYSKKRPTFYD